MKEPSFHKALEQLINRYSKENGSNTPDWILARYLAACLQAFDRAVGLRERWYGRPPRLIRAPEKTSGNPKLLLP